MGSVEPKSDQTVPVMESGLASRTSSATSSESSPTASSSDKDPLLSDSDEASNSRTCSVDLQKNNKNAQLASDYNKEDFPVSPVPRNEQLNDGSAIESPPTQVMDRASETPSHDPNRIPPHVFARTKSTAPVEWSAASNESLFSLHMGNMSFTNEQLNWMNKSGEFGLMGDVQFSGDIPYSPPPPLPLVNKSSEPSVKNGNLNQGLGATEAAAAETMREVIRENACDHNDQQKLPPPKKDPPKKADPRTISAKRSDDSSVKSFAFPILTRDGNKSGSMSIHHEKKKKQHSQPSTPKTASEPGTPKSKSEPGAPTEQTPKATTKNAVLGKWFSCFSCCPFCS